MNKQNLLSYIHHYLDNNDIEHHEKENENYFYFIKNNMCFSIQSNLTSCYLQIWDCNGEYQHDSEVFIISEEEGMELMDKCIDNMNKQQIPYISDTIGLKRQDLKKYFEKVKEKIKTVEISKDDIKANYNGESKYKHTIVVDENVEVELFLGKMMDIYGVHSYGLVSLPKLVINVYFKDKNDYIWHNLFIPAHRFKEYKILEHFAKYAFEKDENDENKLSRILNDFTEGKKLLKEMLELNLDNEKKQSKRAKI